MFRGTLHFALKEGKARSNHPSDALAILMTGDPEQPPEVQHGITSAFAAADHHERGEWLNANLGQP